MRGFSLLAGITPMRRCRSSTGSATIFHLARNDYDRVGHFAQSDLCLHWWRARSCCGKKLFCDAAGCFFIVLSICLAVSAAYELLEWRVAVASGSAADAFLGTQGDPWDTQEDMATAVCRRADRAAVLLALA